MTFDVVHHVFADAVGAIFAVEKGAGRLTGFDGRGRTEYFHGRTRLDGICDGPIAPQLPIIFGIGIRVEVRMMGQRQNRTGFGLHYNRNTRARRKPVHGFLQGAFGDKLDIAVNG